MLNITPQTIFPGWPAWSLKVAAANIPGALCAHVSHAAAAAACVCVCARAPLSLSLSLSL
eukprot:COSAG01_NODE_4753_length_4766_cov_2.343261_9_plen_59_part_01